MSYLLSVFVGAITIVTVVCATPLLSIYSNVSKNTKGVFSAWTKTIEIAGSLVKSKVVATIHKRTKSPKYLSRNAFEIEYYHNGVLYKILIKDSKKKKPSIIVHDENKNDITSDFMVFLGPYGDFHHRKYTPKDLGYTTIFITNELLEEKRFDEHDHIEI